MYVNKLDNISCHETFILLDIHWEYFSMQQNIWINKISSTGKQTNYFNSENMEDSGMYIYMFIVDLYWLPYFSPILNSQIIHVFV